MSSAKLNPQPWHQIKSAAAGVTSSGPSQTCTVYILLGMVNLNLDSVRLNKVSVYRLVPENVKIKQIKNHRAVDQTVLNSLSPTPSHTIAILVIYIS